MNIAGYKSVSVSTADLPNWEKYSRDPAFANPAAHNPMYDTVIINVEDADKYTSIESYVESQAHLGMSMKWKREDDISGKNKVNLIACLCIAGPNKVYVFRSHTDTR